MSKEKEPKVRAERFYEEHPEEQFTVVKKAPKDDSEGKETSDSK